MKDSFIEKIGIFFIGLFFIIFVCFLIAWPFMLLWNWLMPLIFGLIKINFWQSLGLLFLSSMLFKSSNTSTSK